MAVQRRLQNSCAPPSCCNKSRVSLLLLLTLAVHNNAVASAASVGNGRVLFLEDYGGQSDREVGILYRPNYPQFQPKQPSPSPSSSSASSSKLPPSPPPLSDILSWYLTNGGGSGNASLAEWSRRNTKAFNAALSDARPGDCILLKDGESYTLTGGVVAQNVTGVTIDVAGHVRFVHDRQVWPLDDRGKYRPALACHGCENVTWTSSSLQRAQVEVDYRTNQVHLKKERDGTVHLGGSIDGDGTPWWDEYVFGTSLKSRPKLMVFQASRDIVVEHLTLINSPYWTLSVEAVGAEIHHVHVLVDRNYQRSLKTTAAQLRATETPWKEDKDPSRILRGGGAAPLQYKFPDLLPKWVLQPEDLNTDGFDLLGVNVSVHDCVVYNDDDSVAVKPLRNSSHLAPCTENVVVKNMILTGFGASVGSVGPDPHHNCVNRITFSNITMPGTGKGIYIKDSGSDCNAGESSQITNILYEDIHMIEPFWWSIWIGPQAIQEPGGSPGCCKLAYPVDRPCPTQGCATFANITLRNVRIDDPVVSPGVLLGNSSNPMTGIVFDNVTMHVPTRHIMYRGRLPFYESHFPYRGVYHCVNVEGTCIDCHPRPPCLTPVTRRAWNQRQ